MEFWLGPVGDLRQLPIVEWTERVTATREPAGGIAAALSGARTRYIMGRARGTWTIPWRYLDAGQVALLSALRAGRLGGPLRLVDPERPNLAHPQLATGGTEEQDTSGWAATNDALDWHWIADPPAGVLANGAITWTRSTTAAGDLAPGRAGHAYRAPARGTEVMSIGMWVRATSGTVAAAFGVDHFNAAGVPTTVVGSAATVPSTWTQATTTWTPVAGQFAVAPALRIASGQPASVIEITGVQIAYGSTLGSWSEGGGAPVVLIDSLPEDRPWAGETDASLTLVEA